MINYCKRVAMFMGLSLAMLVTMAGTVWLIVIVAVQLGVFGALAMICFGASLIAAAMPDSGTGPR